MRDEFKTIIQLSSSSEPTNEQTLCLASGYYRTADGALFVQISSAPYELVGRLHIKEKGRTSRGDSVGRNPLLV